MLAADQLWMGGTPFGGELAAKGLGEDGLGQLIDAGLGVRDLLLDLIGEGEELVDAADDFSLLFKRRQMDNRFSYCIQRDSLMTR